MRMDDSTDDPGRTAQQVRWLRNTTRWLVIYGLLLAGSLLFSMPFVWMIGTSFKVDREMFGEQITFLPMRPVPARASPYLDERYFPAPRGADAELAALEQALAALDLGLPDTLANRDQAARLLAPGLYRRLRDVLPADTWKLPAPRKTRVSPS